MTLYTPFVILLLEYKGDKMKRIMLFLLLIILVSGCTKNNSKLDFSEVSNSLNNLTYNDKSLFPNTAKVETDILEMKYGVSLESFESYIVVMPTMATSASMYAIFLPKEGKSKEAEAISDIIMNKYASSWTSIIYNVSEAYLVNNMLKTKYNGYIIYIISNNNDLALNTIKSL